MLFNSAYATEFGCYAKESFLFGYTCHLVVHVGPLIILARSCISEVSGCRRDCAVMQEFEPQFGVLSFVMRRFLEYSGYLLVSVFLCL